MKTRFWNSDWFAGLIITILVVVFSGSASFQSLERSAYDWGSGLPAGPPPNESQLLPLTMRVSPILADGPGRATYTRI